MDSVNQIQIAKLGGYSRDTVVAFITAEQGVDREHSKSAAGTETVELRRARIVYVYLLPSSSAGTLVGEINLAIVNAVRLIEENCSNVPSLKVVRWDEDSHWQSESTIPFTQTGHAVVTDIIDSEPEYSEVLSIAQGYESGGRFTNKVLVTSKAVELASQYPSRSERVDFFTDIYLRELLYSLGVSDNSNPNSIMYRSKRVLPDGSVDRWIQELQTIKIP